MATRACHLLLLVGTGLLTGCRHDLTRRVHDLSSEAQVRDQVRAEAILPDARRDRTMSLDRGCPSPCVTTLAGECFRDGYADGPLRSARFYDPLQLTFESPGSLLIADRGNGAIRRLTNGVVTTVAGDPSGCQTCYQDGPAKTAKFSGPSGVAADGAAIFVSDTGNCVLRKVEEGEVSTVAGGKPCGLLDGLALQARFTMIEQLVLHSTLGWLIPDRGNRLLRRLSSGQVTTYVGGGAEELDGKRLEVWLDGPSGVAVDPLDLSAFFLADTHRIRRVAADDLATVLAGSSTSGYRDGKGAQARFERIGAIVATSSGDLLVTDRNAIRRIDRQGNVTVFAGGFASGYLDGPADGALFSGPGGLAIDSDGAVYVADTFNHCIRIIR